jgi:hypothetical protein
MRIGPSVLLCLTIGCSTPASSPPPAKPAPKPVTASTPPCRTLPAATEEIAKSLHKDALATRDQVGLRAAARLYRAYLEHAAHCPDAPKIRYYLAEALWSLADNEPDKTKQAALWEQAARAFKAVIDGAGHTKKERKDAAYAGILAWKNATMTGHVEIPTPPKIPKGDVTPRPIPRKVRRMIQALADYERIIRDPRDKELAMIKFLHGRVYWQYNHLTRAVPRLEAIVRQYPGYEVGGYAANLLLDSLHRLGRTAALRSWVSTMLATPALLKANPDLTQRLRKLHQQTQGTRP